MHRVLDQIRQKIGEEIIVEVQRVVDTANAQAGEADSLRSQLDDLRRERLRLVRVAAATDESVPEVVDALRLNQERSKRLERALTIATRPPIDDATAGQLRTTADGQITRMRQRFDAGEAREAIRALFPAGLRFRVGDGLWLVQGAASVPAVRLPDTVPDAGRAFRRMRRASARKRVCAAAIRARHGMCVGSRA